MKKQILPDNFVVSQSNQLVEADYSEAKLPARALKIGRLIISKISPNDEGFRLIKVKNTAIKQYLGYKGNVPYNRFSDDLDDICKRLNSQTIKIQTKKGTVLNAYLISSFEIDHNTDTTEFEISGKLRAHLLNLRKNYTSYQLKNIPKLNSSYSIRMYELMYQYKKIGKRKIDVDDLKRKLGCNYDLYGHLKAKAIKKAQGDLIKHTDIRFEFEEIKAGRKVVSLVFYIYPNDPKDGMLQQEFSFLDEAIEITDRKEFGENVAKAMLNIGISLENIENMLNKGFDIIEKESDRNKARDRCKTLEAYYLEKITLLDQSKTSFNSAGFLIKALKEDWLSSQTIKNRAKENTKKLRKNDLKKLEDLKRNEERLLKEYEDKRNMIFGRIIAHNPELFEKAYNSVKNHSIIKYKNPQLSPKENYNQSIFLQVKINAFLEDANQNLFEGTKEFYKKIEAVRHQIAAIKKKWRVN